MKKRWMAIFCAALLTILAMAATDTKAEEETGVWKNEETEVYKEGAFTYYIHPSQNGEEAWVYKIEIPGKKGRDLSIPDTILGKKVTRLGRPERGSVEEELDEAYATLFGTYIEPWHKWVWDGNGAYAAAGKLKSIQIPDTVEVIDRAAFAGLDSVKTIQLPKKVKKIEDFTFYGCDKLETIVLPEQLELFENSSLMTCPALKNIKLSKKNKQFKVKKNCLIRKKNKALIIAAATGKKFSIPNGVKTITPYAFRNASCSEIHIPSSVAKIEGKAFNIYGFWENAKIKDVTISNKNPVYARDGQCIYKKSDKSLTVAIPDKKGELRISERVKKLTPDINMVNCNTSEKSLEKLVYPSSLKRVIVPGFGEIDARNVYFTGSVPPKVVDTNDEFFIELPSNCHVYVPKKYEKAYKKWYKKHNNYAQLYGWHTYNP